MKKSANPPIAQERDFSEVLKLIQVGRFQAYRSINVVMIETYWSVGGVSLAQGGRSWLGQRRGQGIIILVVAKSPGHQRIFGAKPLEDEAAF